MSGGIVIVVTGGTWSITVPESNKLSAVFGPLSISAWGSIHSSGTFDLHFSGGICLPDCTSGTRIGGEARVDASFDSVTKDFSFSVTGSFSAWFLGVELFGVSATGTSTERSARRSRSQSTSRAPASSSRRSRRSCACSSPRRRRSALAIVEFFDGVGCEIASWFGSDCKDRYVDAKVTTTEEVEEDKGFTIDVATFTLPATLGPSTPPPPNLATQTGTTLTLNVGTRASFRNVSPTTTAEVYEIAHVSGSALGETIRVSAFGKQEIFSGVTSIIGSFGDGNDSLNVLTGVLIPVEAHGGLGNDTLTYSGSGSAKLFGDENDDSLTLGGASTGTLASLALTAATATTRSRATRPARPRSSAATTTTRSGAAATTTRSAAGPETTRSRPRRRRLGRRRRRQRRPDRDRRRPGLRRDVHGRNGTDRIEIVGDAGADNLRALDQRYQPCCRASSAAAGRS